jgi:hypothetical protein
MARSCCTRAARPSLSRKGTRLLWLFPYWTAPGTLTKTEGFGRIVNKLERSQKTSSKVFTAVRCAASHYAKRALAGRHITTSFLNSFIFLCKYIDSIGQEPCHAKIRKRAVAKGITRESGGWPVRCLMRRPPFPNAGLPSGIFTKFRKVHC